MCAKTPRRRRDRVTDLPTGLRKICAKLQVCLKHLHVSENPQAVQGRGKGAETFRREARARPKPNRCFQFCVTRTLGFLGRGTSIILEIGTSRSVGLPDVYHSASHPSLRHSGELFLGTAKHFGRSAKWKSASFPVNFLRTPSRSRV